MPPAAIRYGRAGVRRATRRRSAGTGGTTCKATWWGAGAKPAKRPGFFCHVALPHVAQESSPIPPPLHPKPFLWLALSIGWMPLILTAYGAERPNIVLVVADDLGYSDLACFGSTIAQTPAFDRFAAEGMKLTACYAGHANCSPSRAALMTGRTPMR
ncbi:MAG: sulfatase-like hydrolase/transferase, partial [Pirellulaceae bacterium]